MVLLLAIINIIHNILGQPYPPTNLTIEVDGLNLVVLWSEPVSLHGEQLSYVIIIRLKQERTQVVVNNTRYYVVNEISSMRDCAEVEFTVFTRSSPFEILSATGAGGKKHSHKYGVITNILYSKIYFLEIND